MDQDTTQSVASEPEHFADHPPLRVHHLLIWTAVTAAYATMLRLMYSDDWQAPESAITMALFVYELLFSSGQLFVCVVVVYWRIRSTIKRIQPGEWLGIYGALESLFGFGLFALKSYYEDQLRGAHASPIVVSLFPTSAFALVLAMLFLWLAIRRREWRGWRLVFLLLGLCYLSIGIGGGLFWASNFELFSIFEKLHWVTLPIEVLLLLSVGILSTRDILRKTRWRWTHWWGIGLWILEQLPRYFQLLTDW